MAKVTYKAPKPRDPSSHLKAVGALRTIAFVDKTTKTGRKAKHKKSLMFSD